MEEIYISMKDAAELEGNLKREAKSENTSNLLT